MRACTFLFVCVVLALSAGCGERPLVVQGTVVSYDAAANVVVVKDDVAPGSDVSFSLTGADIGATPAVGDVVRLAYRESGGTRTALRVMNLTRQADLAKKGGGAH